MNIETKNFTVGYGKQPIIKDICLFVKPGQIMTLIGPNGSGKSTVLKSITRQIKTLGGTVLLDGISMDAMKETEIAKSLSMVMTERIKPELMTCREVVSTGRYPYTGKFGILTKDDWKKVDQAIELLHAKEVSNQNFYKISDGQKQRVMLARAICQEPQFLILDEPTSYLDMRFKLDILSNIRKMVREKKLAVIMSLHELDLALMISDIIACVDGEHINRVGTPEEIFKGDYIQKLYHVSESNFDPVLGMMHMTANYCAPQVFVIGGGGRGIPVYNQLQRADIPFAVGILSENDVEYGVARAISSKVVSTKAFFPIEEQQLKQAKQLIDSCHNCICALNSFGPYNQENQLLKDYAKAQGKLVTK